MYRFAALVLLLLVGGCRNRPTQFDPFLGKTTVPPPGTGSVGSQAPIGSNYPAAPPNWNTQPANPSTVPSTIPNGNMPGTPLPPPQTLSNAGAPPANNTPYQFTGSGSAIRVVPPDPNVRSSFGTPNGGIEIMQLPVKGQGGQPPTSNGGFSGVSNTGGAPPVGPATGYGFDAAYSQLSGRLEYSSLDGRWLLRYVPPESKPDRFGGVAVFVPAGSMAGFRNGDFVTAQGRLEAIGSASPVFTASGIAAQRTSR